MYKGCTVLMHGNGERVEHLSRSGPVARLGADFGHFYTVLEGRPLEDEEPDHGMLYFA